MKGDTDILWTRFLPRITAAVLAAGILAFVGYVLGPILWPGKPGSHPVPCISHVKMLALATLMYAEDFDGRLPDRDHWMGQITPYHKNRQIEHCPALYAKDGIDWNLFGYAFNSNLSCRDSSRIRSLESVSMIYDSINMGRSASDPCASFPVPGRHTGKNNTAFLDGHAKAVQPPTPMRAEG